MTHGVLLAAGAGSRMGRPKALVGDWLQRGVRALRDGGCERVLVVLGAESDRARQRLVDLDVDVVVAEDWEQGMGASLRAGLAALPADAEAALVTLVDLPDVGAPVARRILSAEGDLRRATYDGRPGHPVLLARVHWEGVAASAEGDRGARDYLAGHEVTLVECGDLASGEDVDRLDLPQAESNPGPTHR
ncbi:MAG TPA: nucleotidyltransferase family protein [Marmoricola sp.]|nr:nucleotidyltransferase family protein [Marmoricola sp.]